MPQILAETTGGIIGFDEIGIQVGLNGKNVTLKRILCTLEFSSH